MQKDIDPVSLEVMRNALMSICDEMSAALIRTAYSTNIKDRRDCSCAIYMADGKVAAQRCRQDLAPVIAGFKRKGPRPVPLRARVSSLALL